MTLIRAADWKPQGVDDLEPRAWEALRRTERSVLVTAGAGAGKTEFLAQKATYFLQTGICRAPKRILAISFKRDAARNLTERVEKRCPAEQARRFNSFTFDAFAKNLLDRFRLAVPEPFLPPANYRIIFPVRGDYEDFLERHGHRGIQPGQLEKGIARTKLPIDDGGGGLSGIVSEYWDAQYNDYYEVLLSFSMINRLVEWLLRENPSITKALQLTYPVVFLDEYQDTTYAQFELIRTAFDDSDAVFTAVGDDKQRIMVWAGAMPDAFEKFEEHFEAERISLLSNWRSHEDLVRIQYAIACRIDPDVEYPDARADREVDGDVAAIWQFGDSEQESEILARWIEHQVNVNGVEPHEIAILVRVYANNVENELKPAFADQGLRLRNEARMAEGISIQDLLGENLTALFMPLLRLGSTARCTDAWTSAQQKLQFVYAIDPADEFGLQRLQKSLENFIRELRRTMRELEPNPAAAETIAHSVLQFVGEDALKQSVPAYERQQDFDRVWNGFRALLAECAGQADTWSGVLDEYEGLGQVPLMTIHKSKGLEFHTMIFYGLDNRTWWSLKPDNPEDLNTFFVAFTRAKQRAFFTLCTQRGQPVTWIEELLEPVDVHRVDGETLLDG